MFTNKVLIFYAHLFFSFSVPSLSLLQKLSFAYVSVLQVELAILKPTLNPGYLA
jgi:hypothetical protein